MLVALSIFTIVLRSAILENMEVVPVIVGRGCMLAVGVAVLVGRLGFLFMIRLLLQWGSFILARSDLVYIRIQLM